MELVSPALAKLQWVTTTTVASEPVREHRMCVTGAPMGTSLAVAEAVPELAIFALRSQATIRLAITSVAVVEPAPERPRHAVTSHAIQESTVAVAEEPAQEFVQHAQASRLLGPTVPTARVLIKVLPHPAFSALPDSITLSVAQQAVVLASPATLFQLAFIIQLARAPREELH